MDKREVFRTLQEIGIPEQALSSIQTECWKAALYGSIDALLEEGKIDRETWKKALQVLSEVRDDWEEKTGIQYNYEDLLAWYSSST